MQVNITDVPSRLFSSFSRCSLMSLAIDTSVDTSIVCSEPAVLMRL